MTGVKKMDRAELEKILPDIYEVIGEEAVGHGSSAEVWKVRHRVWDRYLALKVLTEPDAAENIRNECDRWIRLGLHPNIASCYYVREIGGQTAIFCEWCGGGSLRELIDDGSEKLYPEDRGEQLGRLMKIAVQMMLALSYTHSAGGYFHGDVKPDNIMLTENGDVKLTDFGCAGIKGVSGTRAYFSPEQLELYEFCGDTELTAATDVYSWAVTVIEMFMGGRAWDCGTEAGEILRGVGDAGMPDELMELLVRCTCYETALRPDDREILDRLGEICHTYCGGMYSRMCEEKTEVSYFETADFCSNRALSFIDMGQPEEAGKWFAKALEIMPHHSAASYNEAMFDWECGRTDLNKVDVLAESLTDMSVKKFAEKQRAGITGLKFVKRIKTGREYEDVKALRLSTDKRGVMMETFDGSRRCYDMESGEERDCGSYEWDEVRHQAADSAGRVIAFCDYRLDPIEALIYDISRKSRFLPLADIIWEYTFSRDAEMLVYYDSQDIVVYSLGLGGRLNYYLCDTVPVEELINKRAEFEELTERFDSCGDAAEKIALLDELEKFTSAGGDCLEEYYRRREDLYGSCLRKGFRIGAEMMYMMEQFEVSDLIMDADGSYVLYECFEYCGIIDTRLASDRVVLDKELSEQYTVADPKKLLLTERGELQIVVQAEPPFYFDEEEEEEEYDDVVERYVLSFGGDDIYSAVRTDIDDIDGYLRRGRQNFVGKTAVPLDIARECERRGFERYMVNRALTRLLAVRGGREIVMYHIDCDLSV